MWRIKLLVVNYPLKSRYCIRLPPALGPVSCVDTHCQLNLFTESHIVVHVRHSVMGWQFKEVINTCRTLIMAKSPTFYYILFQYSHVGAYSVCAFDTRYSRPSIHVTLTGLSNNHMSCTHVQCTRTNSHIEFWANLQEMYSKRLLDWDRLRSQTEVISHTRWHNVSGATLKHSRAVHN